MTGGAFKKVLKHVLKSEFHPGGGLLQPYVSALPQADGRLEKSHGGPAQPTMPHRETTKGRLSLLAPTGALIVIVCY